MSVSMCIQNNGYYDCIRRKSKLCSTQGVLAMLLKENPGIDKDPEQITYRRWKCVKKEKGKKLDICSIGSGMINNSST